MQFAESSQDNYFFSQPHQPFFVLAFINAILTMVIFLLSYKGVLHIAIADNYFHGYSLTFLLFTPAFFGFLFTTFPRFASTPVLEKKVYMRVFSLFYLGSVLFGIGTIASPIFSALGMFLIFAGQVYGAYILNNIYTTTTMPDKHDIYWINLAMKIGVVSHFIFIIGKLFYAPIVGLSAELALYPLSFFTHFFCGTKNGPLFLTLYGRAEMIIL